MRLADISVEDKKKAEQELLLIRSILMDGKWESNDRREDVRDYISKLDEAIAECGK